MIRKANMNDLPRLTELALELWPDYAVDTMYYDLGKIMMSGESVFFLEAIYRSIASPTVSFPHFTLSLLFANCAAFSSASAFVGAVKDSYRRFFTPSTCSKWEKTSTRHVPDLSFLAFAINTPFLL